MKLLLGRKLKMSQIYDDNGKVVPVTLVEAGPCKILQIKTKDKDGYEAVQIGFVEKKKRIKKTEKGKEFKFIKEYKIKDEVQDARTGDQIDVNIFKEGDIVKVSGISKGKGFQGVVKKWGFHGRPTTHGTKHEVRTPGSVGMSFPERVIKGKKLAGRMGAEIATVRNLKIVKIEPDKNLLAVKGAVPGRRGTFLEIRG
ncbi:MAG: 50S ribosomal protein L3 [Candidatus Nealsonbacteria bacterium CG_4_10_14_0_2_um_filter_38_17]|uniref:Large ribosomal subunit protein uL3 n=2 Tax=Candidatus Nealsoniibacteriota TaxID=1817911 RepID=A0A2M7UY12_9BACT|nr:MAG: 50S ribosomal protein L3 [Candidatus Nealsonbacteria bacterium CG23_combo_of_CG06-09_8_20_14_all_38_19]PIZ88871.1 MAG: 50S ribosomal protein L3 [Candidatus Nealsonbacteria bacterium CG_4_10_14_0_2_um_filter_38_17]